MNEVRIEELWSRFLAQENLTAEEATELREALAASPKLRDDFLQDAQDHGMLQALARSEKDGEAFDRHLGSRIEAESDATRFVRRIEAGLPKEDALPSNWSRPLPRAPGGKSPSFRPPSRQGRASSSNPAKGYLKWGLLAASLLFAAALLFLLGPSESTPAPVDRAGEAKARAAGAAEARWQSEREAWSRQATQEEAERRRLDAEARLQEIRRRQQELVTRTEERKTESLEELQKEKERVERELREASELAKQAERPTPPQATRPLLRASTADPAQSAREATQVAPAQVEEVAGAVFRVTKEGKLPLAAGASLFPGDGVLTEGRASRANIRFPDKTCIELGAETTLLELRGGSGKHLTLTQGTLRAVVAKQPQGQPLIVTTPYGEAKVVGTTLRLVVDTDPGKGMRLEVEEGKVELKNLAQKTVLVESGFYAVAAEGVELLAKALPIDEILLAPRQGRLLGQEWTLARDHAAFGGHALLSAETTYRPRKSGPGFIYDSVKNRPSCAVFTFFADGGKDYNVWIRGRSLPEDPEHVRTGELILELPDAQLTPVDGAAALAADHAYGFNGFFRQPGYGWIGGQREHPLPGMTEEVPLLVRFARSGLQKIRLHCAQSPIWIDGIWFSATQHTRPEARVTGPVGK